MSEEWKSTKPKPFVFVLMPFEKSFDDIYKFGIKGAAEGVGAHAERLDEQLFHEGMLERIFNQIAQAEVIVADMTGQNPNVFYEVGYAHALDKIVLLLTKNADDIPFDLKQRPHIVYGESIGNLKSELSERLKWAISESQRESLGPEALQQGYHAVFLNDIRLYPAPTAVTGPSIPQVYASQLRFENQIGTTTPPINTVYLYFHGGDRYHAPDESQVESIRSVEGFGQFTHRASIGEVPALPKHTTHILRLRLTRFELPINRAQIRMSLQLCFENHELNYPFLGDMSF